MSLIAIPVAVVIAGALIYALSSNAKVAEMGRLMFWCGVLVALFVVAGEKIRIP